MNMYQFVEWGEDLDKEFQGASDRAVAVVGASMLDAQLRIVFEARLPQFVNRKSLFDGSNAPLHSLSGKTELALAFGMISLDEHRNLTLVRKIRNIFAHQLGDLSFETPEISSRCKELTVPIGMRLPSLIPVSLVENLDSDPSKLPPLEFNTPRERFQITIAYLSKCLSYRLLEAMETEVNLKQNIERSSEIYDLQIKVSKKHKRKTETGISELQQQKISLENLINNQDTTKEDKKEFIKRRENIQQLLNEHSNYENSETHRINDFLNNFMTHSGFLDFIRRWESWVETKAKPL